MVLRKITFLATMVLLIFASCEMQDAPRSSGFNSSTNKDDMLSQMTRDIFYQDSIMRVINRELDAINKLYVAYESGIEKNRAHTNQANTIINRIRALNRLLDNTRSELRKSKVENRGLQEMIARFRNELQEKEKKIRELEATVENQQKVIKQKEEQIDDLEVANTRQREKLKRMEEDMRRMKAAAYMDLADMLVKVAVEMPEVRGIFTRRTREEVEQMQEKFLSDAHKHYGQAALYGDSQARRKANELSRKYAFIR